MAARIGITTPTESLDRQSIQWLQDNDCQVEVGYNLTSMVTGGRSTARAVQCFTERPIGWARLRAKKGSIATGDFNQCTWICQGWPESIRLQTSSDGPRRRHSEECRTRMLDELARSA